MDIAKKLLKRVFTKSLRSIDGICRSDFSIRWHHRLIGFHDAKYLFGEKQYAFIHIPKTGGTTVSYVLEKTTDNFVNLHMHRPVSLKCPPQKYKYVTFIRDPVSRVWSYYQMAKRHDTNNPYHMYTSKDIEYFLRHCWEVRDMMCRYLSGYPYKEMNTKFCEIAKNNLDAFFFVGLFDIIEEECNRLLAKFGAVSESLSIPHLRQLKKEELSEYDKKIILQYNRYDFEIYNYFIERRKYPKHVY